jgi:EmrB/QacA subfamily drug resistance transporter
MGEQISSRPMHGILIALAVATLTGSLGISVVTVSLPTLSRAFSTDMSQTQWVILAYLAAVTVSIVTAGRLGDIFGHRRILILGLILFAAASVVCAMAPTFITLVIARAIQGIGGAILMAIPVSIAREMISKERLGSAMGLMGTMSAIGTALGPSAGGTLIASLGWRAAFVALTVSSGVTLLLVVRAIPHRPAIENAIKGKLDLPGTFLLALGLCCYALLISSKQNTTLTQPAVLWIAAVGSTLAFVLVEKRSATPLIPLQMLLDRTTGSGFVMNLLIGTIMMSTLVVGPFFLSFSLGLDETFIGLVMAVGPVTSALSGVPAGRLTDRLGAGRVVLIGLMQTIVGLFCLAFLPRLVGVAGYVVALALLTPGFQMFLAANTTAVMSSAPENQRGRLSGLLGLSRNLGFMTGTSVMSTLFVTILGSATINSAARADIETAFSVTFVAAAGLATTALLVALCARMGQTEQKSLAQRKS